MNKYSAKLSLEEMGRLIANVDNTVAQMFDGNKKEEIEMIVDISMRIVSDNALLNNSTKEIAEMIFKLSLEKIAEIGIMQGFDIPPEEMVQLKELIDNPNHPLFQEGMAEVLEVLDSSIDKYKEQYNCNSLQELMKFGFGEFRRAICLKYPEANNVYEIDVNVADKYRIVLCGGEYMSYRM